MENIPSLPNNPPDDQNSNSPSAQPLSQPPRPKWLVFVLIVGVIILGYAVFAFTQDMWPFKVSDKQQNISNQAVDESASPTSDEFEGWQTYHNEEYGFEFRYPEDWGHQPVNGPYFFDDLTSPDGELKIRVNTATYEGVILEKQIQATVEDRIEYYNVYGFSRNLSDNNIDPENSSRIALFETNYNKLKTQEGLIEGLKLEFNYTKNNEEAALYLFNQILSTFRFIDSSDPTADWQTYRNEEFGFEFLYPDKFQAEEFNEFLDEEQSNRGVTLFSDDLNLNLSINNTIYVGGAPEENFSSSALTIGGIKVNKNIVLGHQGLPYGTWVLRYTFEVNGDSYEFSTFKDGGYYDGQNDARNMISSDVEILMDQILSTFKFIPLTPLGTGEPEICIQVITPARNPQTGETRDFPTPCDVPEGWVKI